MAGSKCLPVPYPLIHSSTSSSADMRMRLQVNHPFRSVLQYITAFSLESREKLPQTAWDLVCLRCAPYLEGQVCSTTTRRQPRR